MDTTTLLGIAFGLGMDAFSVAIAVSAYLKKVSRRQYFRLSWHFGLFQFFMPIAGWLLGRGASGILDTFGRFGAAAILSFLGIKMVRSAFRPAEVQLRAVDPTRGLSLILLSLATSIDAFAVGLSLAMLGAQIVASSALIGVVACLMTLGGMRFGSGLGRLLESRAEAIGGIVLLVLAAKILVQLSG